MTFTPSYAQVDSPDPVNPQDLATKNYVDNHGSPTGTVSMFAAATAPTGWLMCDGSAVSRTTYAALFAVIATTYGTGDGSTTFNVPDCRSLCPVGAGDGPGALSNRVLGTSGGEETHTLAVGEVTSHTHTVSGTSAGVSANHTHTGSTSANTGNQSANHTHTGMNYYSSGSGSGLTYGSATTDGPFVTGINSVGHTHAYSDSFTTAANSVNHTHTWSGTSSATGSGTGHNNMQPWIAFQFIIKT